MKVEGADGKEVFTIVGSTEASPREGRISNESPVGRALLGKRKGEIGRRPRPRRRLLVQDPRHQLAGRPCTGPTSWPPRSRARRSSTTPSRPRARSTSAACAASSCTTRSTGPCWAPGRRSTFLYGVDDMDAMDSQALLTPDAVERYMGVPLSRVPAPEGSTAANYARHFVGEIFFRTFEPLGIKPEFYWVSELYAAGEWTATSSWRSIGPTGSATIYQRVSHVERPSDWLPIQVICENCGRIGTTYATDWDGATVAYACKPDLVTWATRLRPRGPRLAARRPGQAALEPRVGRQVGPARRHHRGLRQGSGDGRRFARPLRRDQPRGLRGRTAAQRRLRVPQRRRQEDVHVARARASRPTRSPRSCRRSSCASSSCGRAPARSSTSTPRATRSRASSTSSTASPPPPPGARSRASCRPTTSALFAYSLLGPTPDVPRPRRLPARLRATSPCCSRSPAWTSRSGWRPRRARR